MCQKAWSRDLGLLILRLSLGAVFIYHGFGKLTDIATTAGFFEMVNIPFPTFSAWVVGLVEFLGGIAIVLGVYARSAALLTGFTMLVALLTVHLGSPWSGSELAILALGGSMGLAGAGAGKWRLLKGECVCGAKACSECSTGATHTH